MPGKELFPSSKDDRGSFRYGTNRKVELTLKHELDDVAKKSVNEIVIRKDEKRKVPPNEEEFTAGRLRPSFVPQKTREKRKTQPVFHEELLEKSPRKDFTFQLIPNIPPYNPLNKGAHTELPDDRTRKYPYTRQGTVTTQEMRKPHLTSMGVVPTRTSVDVPGLMVLMEGKPAALGGDRTFDEMEEANKYRPLTPITPDIFETPREEEETDLTKDQKKKKPAILSSEGTISRAVLIDRQKPHPPSQSALGKARRRRYRSPAKSSRSIASSLRSGEITLPDEGVYSQYDEAIAGIDMDMDNIPTAVGELDEDQRSQASSTGTVKSVKELLEEAKEISSPDAQPLYKKHVKKKESPRRKDDKKEVKKDGKKGKVHLKGKDADKSTPKSERSVDEIISSLKHQSKDGVVSDADRRIKEIMDRVISRASTAPGSEPGDTTPADQSSGVDTRKGSAQDSDLDALSTTQTPQPPVEGTVVTPSLTPMGDAVHSGLSSPLDQQEGKSDVDVPERIPEEDEVKAGTKKEGTPEGVDKKAAGAIQPTESELAIPPAPPSTAVPTSHEEATSFYSSDEEEDEAAMDIKKAWEDLNAPPEVSYEDLVGVSGEQATLEGRHPPLPGFKVPAKAPVYSTSVSFLSSWKPATEKKEDEEPKIEEKKPVKSVHHFCTATSDYQLPKEFQNIGRKYHTPGKHAFAMPSQEYRFGSHGPHTPSERSATEASSRLSHISETREEEERRLSAAARKILQEAGETDEKEEDMLSVWQHRAETAFGEPDVAPSVSGAPLHSDESRLYWTPAPPKLDVPPARVREVLFPDYQRASLGPEAQEMQDIMEEETESEAELTEEEEDESEAVRIAEAERLLFRRCVSMEDLTDLSKASRQREEDIQSGKVDPYGRKKSSTEQAAAEAGEDGEPDEDRDSPIGPPPKPVGEKPDNEIFPVFVPLRRAKSAPATGWDMDETLLVPQDFNTAMDEIQRQKDNIKHMKLRQKLEEAELYVEEEDRVDEFQVGGEQKVHKTRADILTIKHAKKKDEPTPAELALEAGRAYVILPKKKKKKKDPVSMARLEDIEKFLQAPSHPLHRSESLPEVDRLVERELRVPARIRSRHRNSLADLLDFEEYASKRKMPPPEEYETREWVRDIWNVWFDDVFPPTPADSDMEDYEEQPQQDGATTPVKQDDKKDKKSRKESLTSYLTEGIDFIEPLEESEENLEVLQILEEEAEKLTKDIESTNKPKAFDLCRRGALYRKIGLVRKAEDDLNRAIEMEPMLLDAYWNRHLLYILQDKKQAALDDLNFILKKSKQHAGAYRSMAEIYRRQGDITMAIVNYSQAIKLDPKDHEAYFRRAQMYEERGDMLLALEDYAKTTKIMPSRTDAILKHGLYYFENENWNNAIADFTELLKVDPLNAMARTYRGRAYSKMSQWSPAVEDLSAAIHLDPNNWQAFYYRACILRKAHPKRALQDYSVSLLIDDTEENIMSYLHRGILYNSMGKPEEAIPDFESVLKLNKDVACAHVNLGLIYMTHYENYHRAIKKFSSAIKVDPTYVRAYVCRGEAYHKVHELKLALKDFTRAIHLRPDVPHYYMYRGQLVLELGNLELAAFCVRHASELSSDSNLGQMPTQQAVVQSFLKSYEKAIAALEAAARQKPVGPLFMLLGKTQMKAKQFKEAIVSFEKALQLFKPWRPRDPWPQEASEAHFLIGMCHSELRQYVEALEAFTNAIKQDGNYAEAWYQRGVSRMKLKVSKGIQDFNRALAIDPKIFQAYLSRACYYGLKGNYTKAILNCNEAIRLQPKSVRAYLYRGALKYHIKAYDLAIRDLTKAASIDSLCGLAYFNRAVCYQEHKQYHKALQDYGIVMLLGEHLMLKVLINRGLLYFEKKDYTNALYDFKMAAKLSPTDHRILHTLGLCYHKLDQLQEAVDVFTTCINKNPFFLDGIIARGNVYMDCGQQEGIIKARRDYEHAMRLDPLCLPARINLAYTLQVSGKFMQAWRQFTSAIDLKPNFKPALEGRAIINLQMSDTFAAFQDINASIKVSATAELLTNRGVINQFMQDRSNAMRDFQEALRLDPTYSLAYFNAANVYFHTRHFREALGYYNKAIVHNPKDESAFLNRAITKVMLRDAPGALEDFKAALKLSPYSAHMYFNRGNLYASTEQYDKAEKDYCKALDLQPDDALVLKRRADVRGKLGKREEAIEDYKQAIEIQSRRKGQF